MWVWPIVPKIVLLPKQQRKNSQYLTRLFVAWFEKMLLRRLQLARLLGVLCGRVGGRLRRRRTLALFGRAGLVGESWGRTVGHRQLPVLLLRLLLLLLHQLLGRRPLFGLAEVCVRRVQQEVPALGANLGGRGRGRGVDGALRLEVLLRVDGRLADGVDRGWGCGQGGRGARPGGCLRDDPHEVLLLQRLLRAQVLDTVISQHNARFYILQKKYSVKVEQRNKFASLHN